MLIWYGIWTSTGAAHPKMALQAERAARDKKNRQDEVVAQLKMYVDLQHELDSSNYRCYSRYIYCNYVYNHLWCMHVCLISYILYCIILCYVMLCYIVLYYIILYYIIFYSILFCYIYIYIVYIYSYNIYCASSYMIWYAMTKTSVKRVAREIWISGGSTGHRTWRIIPLCAKTKSWLVSPPKWFILLWGITMATMVDAGTTATSSFRFWISVAALAAQVESSPKAAVDIARVPSATAWKNYAQKAW